MSQDVCCDLNNHHEINPNSTYLIHLIGNTEGSNGQRSSVTTVASPSSNGISQSDSSTTMDIDANGIIPFALVDEIADASPAADDGLQLGDQVLKFGNVEGGDDLLRRLASEAQINQGRPIPVVVMRHGTPVNLTVTPRSWQGRGLLGYVHCTHCTPKHTFNHLIQCLILHFNHMFRFIKIDFD